MTSNVLAAVEKNREIIMSALDYIWNNPETGYKEIKTSGYMEDTFKKLGYDIVKAEDITGFYTVIDTGKEGPEILILGELDSLICPDHPDADKETGAVHCCGHCNQCAALVGIAAALKEPGVLDNLSGRIRLCAVPAEELIEIEYRTGLMREGKIKYFVGKTEYLYRGYFDGVDLAFMVHSTSGNAFVTNNGNVGCIAKSVEYKGKASHAGGNPWEGCNALYAATSGLNAVNSIRETFKEKDIIRVHPIITHGGSAVNAIPDRVIMESYVRGASFEGMEDANKRVNRALIGAALSMGANVEICDKSGYAPCINSKDMIEVVKDAMSYMPDEEYVHSDSVTSGSTDMGDLSVIMPCVHLYAPGVTGVIHGADYKIEDPDKACVGSAKLQLIMLTILLKDDAWRAKDIMKNFKPEFSSKEEYFKYIDSLGLSGDRIQYTKDGATVIL